MATPGFSIFGVEADWKVVGACMVAGIAVAALCLAGSVYRSCVDQSDHRKRDGGETVGKNGRGPRARIANPEPIPYRPFKWGEYQYADPSRSYLIHATYSHCSVTMGIRSMPWDEWVELSLGPSPFHCPTSTTPDFRALADQQFYEYHKITEFRIRTRPNRVIMYHPPQAGIVGSARPAAEELIQELAEFLVRRYPALYSIARYEKGERGTGGWHGAGQVKTITIVPLQVTYDLGPRILEGGESAVGATSLHCRVQEDWAIMLEGTDGRYWLQAGAVCKPGFWRLQDKLGMPLEEIHLSGNVPQYKSKLHLSMARFFRRMAVDKPVTRNNYFFQVVKQPELQSQDEPAVHVDPTEISWSRTMHGFEDKKDFERAALIREEKETVTENVAEHQSTEPLDPTTVFLRTERQTLRRLPKTGAIVFTIRVYQTRVTDLAKEPGVPGRLASSIRGWSEDVAQYKDLFAYKDILQYLDAQHADQLEKGLTSPEARSSAYPF
ncbi:uncharacterized protein B0H18DRAFT_949969 [Fomitopsis serialis]|uniref:uncharacterized protein n=1 Tax=Fomitopsis serialis TaxID=139415 RepID=UPI002007AF40|nr:uncharacterized protein B0H18DRAFT_949969 [Neoantrodia serialis]KAH9938720.1 hypothetical protein B0H18DRAFT_949969 [Neoantrodia serialis]